MKRALEFLAAGLIVHAVASACSQDADGHTKPAKAQSGERLKARFTAGADGSKAPVLGMFDSERGEACSFQPATDGTLRCMPIGVAAGYDPNAYVSGTESHE